MTGRSRWKHLAGGALAPCAAATFVGCGSSGNLASTTGPPQTQRWQQLAAAPDEADNDVLVWTGSELLDVGIDVHGSTYGIGGAAFSPRTGRWRVLPYQPDAVVNRSSRVEGVWTGSELVIVVTNQAFAPQHDLGSTMALRPSSSKWTSLPAPPEAADDDRTLQVAWTGHAVTLFGLNFKTWVLLPGASAWRDVPVPTGVEAQAYSMGYNELVADLSPGDGGGPAWEFSGTSDRWRHASSPPPVHLNDGGSVTWAENRLLVVQRACDGPAELASYSPKTDRWTERRIDPGPLDCGAEYSATWAGDELVYLETYTASDTAPTVIAGAALNPTTGHWQILPQGPAIAANPHSAVWDGTELLVVGTASPGGLSPTAAYRAPRPLPPLGPPPTTVPPATLPVCAAANLRADLVTLEPVSNETLQGSIGLTNTTTRPCHLSGTPSLQLLDSDRRPIPITIHPSELSPVNGPTEHGPVTLAPGRPDTALVAIQYEDKAGEFMPCSPISPPSAGGILLIPPDDNVSVAVTDAANPQERSTTQVAACNSSIMMGPITAATTYG